MSSRLERLEEVFGNTIYLGFVGQFILLFFAWWDGKSLSHADMVVILCFIGLMVLGMLLFALARPIAFVWTLISPVSPEPASPLAAAPLPRPTYQPVPIDAGRTLH